MFLITQNVVIAAEPSLNYAHSYSAALAEAKDRNCVIFVAIHIDH